MPVIIQKLLSTQISDVLIISVGSDPLIYAVHMPQLFARVLKTRSVKATYNAMQSYLKSDLGKVIESGGDIAERKSVV